MEFPKRHILATLADSALAAAKHLPCLAVLSSPGHSSLYRVQKPSHEWADDDTTHPRRDSGSKR